MKETLTRNKDPTRQPKAGLMAIGVCQNKNTLKSCNLATGVTNKLDNRTFN